MVDHEKSRIEQEFASKQQAQELAARQAWRGLLVPAVGSAAFFASAVVGFIRTYRKYGFPHDAFKPFDYAPDFLLCWWYIFWSGYSTLDYQLTCALVVANHGNVINQVALFRYPL